jgi:putative ubiquitin-RnfH superfamily antitoxin RatB of RatAB toxin-antitoxin module
MMIRIEIAYALPDAQTLVSLSVPAGSTVEQAIAASDVPARHPDLDWRAGRVGIFGRIVSLDRIVQDGDRIEIYRPLVADPKSSRQARVEKRRAERGDVRKMRP